MHAVDLTDTQYFMIFRIGFEMFYIWVLESDHLSFKNILKGKTLTAIAVILTNFDDGRPLLSKRGKKNHPGKVRKSEGRFSFFFFFFFFSFS